MSIKGMHLAWIVVNDLKAAVKYYGEVIGLQVKEMNEAFGWAELEGHEGGARLGIAQTNPREPIKAGSNAIITLTVDDLEKSIAELSQKGVKLVGKMIDIPGIVKLQMFEDADGNHLQIVQTFHHK